MRVSAVTQRASQIDQVPGSTGMKGERTALISGSAAGAGLDAQQITALALDLGARARRDELLRDHTAIRTGGPAELLITCDSAEDLVRIVTIARSYDVPWLVFGGGCNVLVADSGVRGVAVINRAGGVRFREDSGVASVGCQQDVVREGDVVKAESGALLSSVARDAVARGMEGLEWAAGLPGTVGGAVVGNAGAFGGDVAHSLVSAVVLAPDGEVSERPAEWFQFEYRTSRLKCEGRERHVLLSVDFALRHTDPATLAARAEENLTWRRTRHPSGATMGSTFKNPPGSHAGYLIEQAGLGGHRIGGAEISTLHGNFIMNAGGATANDVLALIEYARAEVLRRFGIEMELEIELIGW